jgi:hypothetical protein
MRAPNTRHSRGFSFTEVLFAVMILGVGFIMVAAIFPVAIQQARTSTEETTGAAVSRGGANYLEKIATNSIMPVTGNVVVAPDYDADGDRITISNSIRGSMVGAADSRIAWVPFYRRIGNIDDTTRASWSPYAQVFMVPVHVRNQTQYINANGFTLSPFVQQMPGRGIANINVDITDGTAGAPDVIDFKTFPQFASEGAYVIIADARRNLDPNSTDPWETLIAPNLQGRIYRLGNAVAGSASQWELMPGFDFDPPKFDRDGIPTTPPPYDHDKNPLTPDATDGKEYSVVQLTDVKVFVVGRGVSTGTAPNAANMQTEGTAQDVAAYTTFVYVK